MDINAWISMHGYQCMDIHEWISMRGYTYMDVGVWIFLHGYLVSGSSSSLVRFGPVQSISGPLPVQSRPALAQDLYPGKPYDKVRSTVSEYIGILVDAGLLHKMRKGKQTYIATTQKGQDFFQKNNPKQKKKPIAKAK